VRESMGVAVGISNIVRQVGFSVEGLFWNKRNEKSGKSDLLTITK